MIHVVPLIVIFHLKEALIIPSSHLIVPHALSLAFQVYIE